MEFAIGFFTLAGLNFTFWTVVGGVRFLWEKLPRKKKKKRGRPVRGIKADEVAAVIPAHNEEGSIEETLRHLLKVLPPKNIYIANDASSDRTSEIARKIGVNVNNIYPNGGKAKALVSTFKKFNIYRRYKAVLIHDADVTIHKDYMKYALPYFKDKKIACVAPHQMPSIKRYGWWENLFILYRMRLWTILQPGMRYGMTFGPTNVTYIVPGGLSMYRTSVLKKLDIDAPNLVIEDFNMTFELRKKKLGRVAYDMRAKGYSQDPHNMKDYVKQVKRWNLGFWQAALRNGIWPGLFWLSTGGFIVEMFLYAIFVISVPVIILGILGSQYGVIPFSPEISALDIIVGLFIFDYLLTILVVIIERRPLLLLYGPLFVFLRYIDSALYVLTLPKAFYEQSTGQWKSPRRKL